MAGRAANAMAKSPWHLGINPLNQALADGFQGRTNKTKHASFAISLKVAAGQPASQSQTGGVAMQDEEVTQQRTPPA